MRNKLAIGVIIGVLIGVSLSTVVVVLAGNPAGPGTPPGSTSAYTLADIYHSLNRGTAASPSTFTGPAVAPGTGTMYTLDEIYALTRQRAPVPKTGQTTSSATGDDGDLQRGVAWPDPRFTDNGDGTVTDNLTGLIWLKSANCWGGQAWANALTSANGLASGSCGLTDGSEAGDWRLPNVRELQSLMDYGQVDPALPSGHPFTGVWPAFYWSGTTFAGSALSAWIVDLSDGYVGYDGKADANTVWPVRGGQ